MKALIIGFGNELCADDGFGRVVAGILRDRLKSVTDVTVLECMQLLPELIDQLNHCAQVVFVDAALTDEPGKLTMTEVLKPDAADGEHRTLSHRCSPAEILDAAEVLYRSRPDAWLCSVGARCLELGKPMSDAVSDAIPQATEMILARLNLS